MHKSSRRSRLSVVWSCDICRWVYNLDSLRRHEFEPRGASDLGRLIHNVERPQLLARDTTHVVTTAPHTASWPTRPIRQSVCLFPCRYFRGLGWQACAMLPLSSHKIPGVDGFWRKMLAHFVVACMQDQRLVQAQGPLAVAIDCARLVVTHTVCMLRSVKAWIIGRSWLRCTPGRRRHLWHDGQMRFLGGYSSFR